MGYYLDLKGDQRRLSSGQIVDVSPGVGRRGKGKDKPYIFINFAHWKGQCVKINLWSEALAKSGVHPTAAWAGRWVTIKGLVEPVYTNHRYNYQHISIEAASPSQITQLTETEARYRSRGPGPLKATTVSNAGLLNQIKGGSPLRGQTIAAPAPQAPLTLNQLVLQKIRQHARPPAQLGRMAPPSSSQRQHPGNHQQLPVQKKSNSGIPWWVWVVAAFIAFVLFKKHLGRGEW